MSPQTTTLSSKYGDACEQGFVDREKKRNLAIQQCLITEKWQAWKIHFLLRSQLIIHPQIKSGISSSSRTKGGSSVEFCLRLKVSKLSKVICLHFLGHAHMMYHIKYIGIQGTWNLIHVNDKGPPCVNSWVKDLQYPRKISQTNYHLIFTLANWSKTKIVQQPPKKEQCFLCGQSISCFWTHPSFQLFFEVLASNRNMSIFSIVPVS